MDQQHLVNMLTLNPQLATTLKRSRSSSDASSSSSSSSSSDSSSGSDSESAPSPPPQKKRAVLSRINEGNKKKYHSGKIYIFDYDPRTDQPGMESSRNTVHEENCDQMHRFFHDHTPYQVIFVPAMSSSDRLVSWWANELDHKNDGELVIVYYHGHAYQSGEDYTWSFRKRSLDVSAWDFIKTTNESNCDALFILDCFVATRGKLPTRSRHHTEFIIAGMHMPVDRRGNEVGHNNFTFCFTQHLTNMVEGMNYKYRNWTKTTTLPGLLRADRELASNPLRVWTKGTRKSPQIKYRFVVEPEHMRRTGLLKLFRLRIEAPGEETGNGRDEDDDDDDDDDFDYGQIEEELASQRDARKKQSKQTSAKSKAIVTDSDDDDMEVDNESSSSDQSDSSDDSGSDDESTSSDDEHGDQGPDGSGDKALFVAKGNDGLVAGNAVVAPASGNSSSSGGPAIENDGLIAANPTVAPGRAESIGPLHQNDGQVADTPVVAPACAKSSGSVGKNGGQIAGNAVFVPKHVAKIGPFVDDDEEEDAGEPAMQRDKTHAPVTPQEMQQCQVHTPAIQQEVQQRKIHSPIIDLTVEDDADDNHEVEDIKPVIFVKVERRSPGLVWGSGSLDQPYLIE